MKYFHKWLFSVLFYLVRLLEKSKKMIIDRYYKSILDIHPTVRVGNCYFDKRNISIGEGTYIKSGEIYAGEACVTIGKFCAIGKNVSIKARTHDLKRPTADPQHSINLKKYADITIGDHVWIGDNAFIKEGVNIGDHVVIGANSVVVKDIPPRAIVGGVPAQIIRYNESLESEN